MGEIRIVSADGFPEWVVKDGAWFIFTRDAEGRLMVVCGDEEPMGLVRTRAELEARFTALRARKQKILAMRISPENAR